MEIILSQLSSRGDIYSILPLLNLKLFYVASLPHMLENTLSYQLFFFFKIDGSHIFFR